MAGSPKKRAASPRKSPRKSPAKKSPRKSPKKSPRKRKAARSCCYSSSSLGHDYGRDHRHEGAQGIFRGQDQELHRRQLYRGVDMVKLVPHIRRCLKNGVASGALKQVTGTVLSDRTFPSRRCIQDLCSSQGQGQA